MTDTNYPRPPITEAVIGIDFAEDTPFDSVQSTFPKYQNEYPNRETFASMNVNIEHGTENTKNGDTKLQLEQIPGFRLSSPDMTRILAIMPGTFLISQLAPYQGWDTLFERFQQSWKIWKQVIGFKQISRIGLRYINRIDIPIENNKAHHVDYINLYPNLPLNWTLDNYAVQLTMPLENNVICQINSATVESPLINHRSIVLDMDFSIFVDVPQNDPDIFKTLNYLRTQKNSVFETFITDKSRSLFQ